MLYTRHYIVGTLLCAVAIGLISAPARSQPLQSATQRIVLEVAPVTRFSVSGDPAPLIIYLGPGLQSSREVHDASSSYTMMSNDEQLKIVASIDKAMPRGLRLFIELTSEQGRSRGRVDISRALAPVALVTGIRRGAEPKSRITYYLSADSSVDFNLLDSRIITLTLTE